MLTRSCRVFALIALQVVTATAAFAECDIAPPFCQGFWAYPAVFDGTAVREETVELEHWVEPGLFTLGALGPASRPADQTRARLERISLRLVTFFVHRSWRGVGADATEVQILEVPAGMYTFRATIGQRYLIVGGPSERGYLQAYTCGRTRLYQEAGEQLAFLEMLTQPARGGRIYGEVRDRDELAATADARPPGNLRLKNLGGGGDSTLRITRGPFEFTGLAPGRYALDIEVSKGTKASSWGAGVTINIVPRDGRLAPDPPPNAGYERVTVLEIPNARACAWTDIHLEPAGSVSGTIGGSSDAMSPVFAELWRVDESRNRSSTSRSAYIYPQGRFEFDAVGEGEYVLGVRFKDPPAGIVPPYKVAMLVSGAGAAHEFRVATGERLQLPPFTVPSFEADANLDLSLAWSDGTPVGNAYIRIVDVSDESVPEAHRGVGAARTDQSGRVRISAMTAHTYVVSVWTTWGTPGAGSGAPREVSRAAPFTAASDVRDVRVILPGPAR